MALKNLQCFYLLSIFIIVHVAEVSTIHVETVPDTFNEILTEKLDITCTYNGSHSHANAKQIIMIEVILDGQSPLVILRGGKITPGAGMRSDMKAEGYVKEDASHGILHLSITNPRRQDAGTYECMMFYLDEMFQMKQVKAATNATLEELDLATVVGHLARKISGLKKTVEEQGDVISRQRETIQGHERQLDEQKSHIQEHNDTKGQESNVTVSYLQEQIKEQNHHIEQQDTIAQATKADIAYLHNKTLELDNIVAHQNTTMQKQADQLKDQEKLLKQQNLLLTTFQSTSQNNNQQLKDHKEHKDHIDAHDKKDKETAQYINSLLTEVSQLKIKMYGQERLLSRHDGSIRQQSQKLSEYDRRIGVHDKEIKTVRDHEKFLETKYSYSSAFSYGFHKMDTFDVGKTILFTEPILNIGDDYDPETGVFTAPRDGLYVFHLFVTTVSAHWAVEIALKVNKEKTVASLHARDEDHWDQSSINTVVSLKNGDTLKPVVTYKNTGNIVVSNDHYSIFSGYLLKAL